MVAERPIPRTAGARPPFMGGPPVKTTFSHDPDDRDDMLAYLRDNVVRLVAEADRATPSRANLYLRLLEQRREWVQREIEAETLLNASPAAPLGIPENPYDLAALPAEPRNVRERAYEDLLFQIEQAMARSWARLVGPEEPDAQV